MRLRNSEEEDAELVQKGYDFLKKLDEELSEFFCIPKSIKITTVNQRNSKLLPCISRIHYPHSEYYIRESESQKIQHLYRS